MTLIIIVSIVMILIIIPVAVYSTARASKQFTTLNTGEIKFIVAGESFKRLLIGVPNVVYDKKSDTLSIDPTYESRQNFLERLAGIYYVSILYPLQKVHIWFFEWDKFVSEDKSLNETEHKAEWVDSLYWEFPYPVNAHAVELKDGLKIDIHTRMLLRVIRPVYLTFNLKGKWFSNAVAAITSLINDFGKSLDIKEMMDPDKSGSQRFQEFFSNHDMILMGSIQIVEASMKSFEQIGTTEAKAALEKIKLSKLKMEEEENLGKAEGNKARERKRGEADGELLILTAKAQGLGKIRSSLGDELTARQIEADKVTGFEGQALSLGGSAQQVLVPIETKKEEEKKDKK